MRTVLVMGLALALLVTGAQAEIVARFGEGAPKDRFSFVNEGACALGPMTLAVDLRGSAGGLIFDVTDSGAGVQVFQPFDLISGAEAVIGQPVVKDGDTVLSLEISRFEPGARIAFTIDVDDTLTSYGTMISGSEIRGATVSVSMGSGELREDFSTEAVAVLPLSGCLS